MEKLNFVMKMAFRINKQRREHEFTLNAALLKIIIINLVIFS